MKLDETTITILKNFQTINPSIQIDEGNVILTKSPTGTIGAMATVQNDFPRTFAIYELKRFLSVANMFKDGEIEFDETFLTFRDGKKSLRYTYCDPVTIMIPKKRPEKFAPETVFFEFTLTAEMLKEALAGMNVLGHEGIVIKGKDGKLVITTSSQTNADSFALDIGETDKDFAFILESQKLNMIPKDYLVSLSRKRFLHLDSDDLQYWIAAHKSSYVNE